MPRTTLDLDRSVLEEIRRRGAREHKSMGQVASEILGSALGKGKSEPSQIGLRWHTGRLGRPSVDLEDDEAVRRALDPFAGS